MSNLIDIINQQAEYTRNSKVAVDSDASFSWVSIYEIDNPDNCVFMQGEEADQWIDEARELWESAEHISMETAELAQAHPYVDLLGE